METHNTFPFLTSYPQAGPSSQLFPASQGMTDNGFECLDCGKRFAERTSLTRHRIAHADAKHICEECGRAFVRDDKLKRHIRSVHSKERPFACEVCSKAFARKDKLQEHVRHHNRDITFPCPACNEIFVMRSHLNRHLRAVHQVRLLNKSPASSVLPFEGISQEPCATKLISKKAGEQRKSHKTSRPEEPNVSQSSTMFCDPNLSDSSAMVPHPIDVPFTAPLFYQQQLQQHPSLFLKEATPAEVSNQLRGTMCPIQNVNQLSGVPEEQWPFLSPQPYLQQQQIQGTPPDAFSAAVAASLFSSANYANWWPQANSSGLILPPNGVQVSGMEQYLQPSGYLRPPTFLGQQHTQSTMPHQPNDQGSQSHQVDSATIHRREGEANSLQSHRESSAFVPVNGSNNSTFRYNSTDVLASLPPFAQAMYYQAATLAASQGPKQYVHTSQVQQPAGDNTLALSFPSVSNL